MKFWFWKTQELSIKDVLKSEVDGMSEWLSTEQGLEYISECTGIVDITNPQNEVNTGKYFADIIADSPDGKVIIENQLGKSDHDHLGKLLTYSALKEGENIIWISGDYNIEHQRTFKWLNDVTDETVNFFFLKLSFIVIGDSKPAPHFELLAGPNIQKKADKRIFSERFNQRYKSFWDAMVESAQKNDVIFTRKPRGDNWYDCAKTNDSSNLIRFTIVGSKKILKTHIIFNKDSESIYESYKENSNKLKEYVSDELQFLDLEGKKTSDIRVERKFNDVEWSDDSIKIKWFLEKHSELMTVIEKQNEIE